MKNKTVLIIEDTESLRYMISECLQSQGIKTVEASTGDIALDYLGAGNSPDLILLDVMLPIRSGFEILPEIQDMCSAPIIIISAKSKPEDKIKGLDLGADDYISKPFDIGELIARVKANIRRENRYQEETPPHKIKFRNWIVDFSQMQVFDQNGNSAGMTPNEFLILEVLISKPKQVFTRDMLLEKTRKDHLSTSDRAIDAQLSRIRKKLNDTDQANSMIQPVRGIGYIFAEQVEPYTEDLL